jgi:hypothetical protein
MFCVKCGSEIGDDAKFCPKCGNSTVQETVVKKIPSRQRPVFTSFWLIFSAIMNFVSGMMCLMSPQIVATTSGAFEDFIPKDAAYIYVLIGIFSIVGIFGNILMLLWKKIGFWVYIVIYVVLFPFQLIFISGGNITSMMPYGMIHLVTVGVLYIRKNGKNTWSQLG